MPLAPELIKELQEFLSKVTISQILKNHWKQHAPREVIRISSTLSVEEAFDVLVKYNISAAPVYNESSSSYLGMVSMHDVAEVV
ncbi:hypothetical protein HMI56_005110 [Coelomomyces lativittatus]|nr:hypothetical protein HMI56_005110 [Coelomomyces lativittatus]